MFFPFLPFRLVSFFMERQREEKGGTVKGQNGSEEGGRA